MTISRVDIEVPDAIAVDVTSDSVKVELGDGRTIWVPLTWYPRLLHATRSERNNWRLIGRGQGIHWDDIDEDVSVESLLAWRSSGENKTCSKRWLTNRSQDR